MSAVALEILVSTWNAGCVHVSRAAFSIRLRAGGAKYYEIADRL
jgi:hypothetical protein